MLRFKLWSFFILSLLYNNARADHPCDGITGTFNDWIGSATYKEVVVVGGGISGLSATKTLIDNQVQSLVLLEAQDYLGGRVKTLRQGTILVEEGAEWMNGGNVNPLYSLANTLGGLTQPLDKSLFDWRARTSDGKDADLSGFDVCAKLMEECEKDAVQLNYHDSGYGQCYEDKFPNEFDTSQAATSGEKSAWHHYLQMWVNKDTGTNNWMDLSGRDADHFTDWGNDEWNQWKNGFDTLTNYLKKNIPIEKIKTSSPVCKVFWNSDPEGRVLVVTENRKAYIADFIIMTASVGHLKERHLQLFDPPLPTSYQNNLNRMELGLSDKVQLGWKSQWWNTDPNVKKPLNLHVIFQKFDLPAEESWLYGIMEFLGIHQQDKMIQAFVTGDRARLMETLSNAQVKDHLLKHLRRVTGQAVPEPTFFKRSQWLKNVWMRGSYNSFVSVSGDQAGLRSRDPLAVPIANSKNRKVIFWAGEHTDTTRYGTVDGAMESGKREAFKVLDGMVKLYG